MDQNDFYTQSLMAGAKPDDFGGIHHTTASISTMRMNQENERFHNETMHSSQLHRSVGDFRPPVQRGFWNWLFND